MSEQIINESLSALLDDEANELDIRRILKSAEESANTKQQLHRFQLARMALHEPQQQDQSASWLSIDLSEQISAALEDEVFDSQTPATEGYITNTAQPSAATAGANAAASSGSRWFGQFGGLAVAASVAAVVVVGSQLLKQGVTEPNNSGYANAPQTSSLIAAAPLANSPLRNVRQGADMSENSRALELQRQTQQQQVRAYMQVHARHASMNGSQGALPLARVASFTQ